MNNQDIQETQVRIADESEKNPLLFSLKDTRARRGNLQLKKGKNLPQALFQSCIQKVKRNVERENLLQIVALREKSPQKLHYTQRRKRNMVKGEDEIILQLLGIHPQLMEMIQMTHSQHTRFKIVTEDGKFKWKLPKGMTSYANKYFKGFNPEGDLKEAILTQSPVSENMVSGTGLCVKIALLDTG